MQIFSISNWFGHRIQIPRLIDLNPMNFLSLDFGFQNNYFYFLNYCCLKKNQFDNIIAYSWKEWEITKKIKILKNFNKNTMFKNDLGINSVWQFNKIFTNDFSIKYLKKSHILSILTLIGFYIGQNFFLRCAENYWV